MNITAPLFLRVHCLWAAIRREFGVLWNGSSRQNRNTQQNESLEQVGLDCVGFPVEWNEDRTPAKGPDAILSAGCQAFSRSWVWTVLGHGELLRPLVDGGWDGGVGEGGRGARDLGWGWGCWPRGCPCSRSRAERDAVLSGVGLQVDSLDSSSSEEQRFSPDFLPEPLAPAFAPLELAARSCLRNLARRFWNQTWGRKYTL